MLDASWSGSGDARVRFGSSRDSDTLEAKGIQFTRGAWTTDRLSFYFRDDQQQVVAGVIIEDYFSLPTGALTTGTYYGAQGSFKLQCSREIDP